MSSSRQIYWLANPPAYELAEKISILAKLKIDVRIVNDLDGLLSAYTNNRLNTVIIQDTAIQAKFLEQLARIAMHPEFSGVRFILSKTQASLDHSRAAVQLGFRDIIPFDLSQEQWIRRYSFASSGKALDLAEPFPQITMKAISSLQIPARIAWINETELWLESRLVPPLGTTLTLGGSIASHLGVKNLTLRVKEHHNTNLHFRYSDALLCQWQIARNQDNNRRIITDFIKHQPTTNPLRIYCILRSSEFRKNCLHLLSSESFQVSLALNKTNMIHEPRFIGPDLIVIEDKMALGANQVTFQEMLQNLSSDIPILIIGPQASKEHFTNIPQRYRLYFAVRIEANFTAKVSEIAAPRAQENKHGKVIPKEHQLSFGTINLAARVTKLHPDAAQLAIQYPLGRFGICGLEVPLLHNVLNRIVHFKVTDCQASESQGLQEFPYLASGLLVDIGITERKKIAATLLSYYQSKLSDSTTPQVSMTDISPASSRDKLEEKLDSISVSHETIQAEPSAASIKNVKPIHTKEPTVAGSIALIWRKIRPEWKITFVTVALFLMLFALLFNIRPSQEQLGGFMTEQLRFFKEKHQRSR